MDDGGLVQLVEKARSGCRDSMERLSVQIQDELYSYIYRLTLNTDLAHDIRQETLLQMCRSLKNLQEAERFKPWLYKTAWGKVKNHYRTLKNKKPMSIYDNNSLVDALQSNCTEGLKTLVSREIAETLVRSISALDVRQKNVLILRCYENLSYKQIAAIMDCSDAAARLLFFRAKNSLKTKLRKKGVMTQFMFLGLLGLFGQITSPTKAAVTVSASTLKVGAVAATVGYLLSKVGGYLISLIAGLGIIGGAVLMETLQVNPLAPQSKPTEIKSFHFIEQSWDQSFIPNANLLMGKSLSRGGYEKWFFFPEGVNGPMFLMTQRWDPQIQNKLCGWLLDGDGQKYYHSGQNAIYLFNSPLPKQKTLRFPSDSPELAEFLDKMEGTEEGVDYTRDPKTGMLVELRDNRFANAKNFSSDISYNVLDEKTFDSFRYKWPDAKVIDERDEIHKLGWTSFEIRGKINGSDVHGVGRIPFVYNKCNEYPPLLKLQIGTKYTLIDSPAGAFILGQNGGVIVSYPTGSFFKGLMRPWYGIHIIDTLRRDAAEQFIPFTMDDFDFEINIYNYKKRLVTLYNATGHPDIKISLLVDIEKNQIEMIEFTAADNNSIGKLEFIYPTNPAAMTDTVDIPDITKPLFTKEKTLETLWLFNVAWTSWP